MKQKIPKKITPTYLENAALFYLQRFATSVANFRTVMHRKIDKSCAFHETNPREFYPVVEDLIERYTKVGLLNDAVFTQSKVNSFRRRGDSAKMITQKLLAKGLDHDIIEAGIDNHAEELDTDAEMAAARNYIKRRRIGAYRSAKNNEQNEALHQKDLASLARAGYSYDTAKKALDLVRETLNSEN